MKRFFLLLIVAVAVIAIALFTGCTWDLGSFNSVGGLHNRIINEQRSSIRIDRILYAIFKFGPGDVPVYSKPYYFVPICIPAGSGLSSVSVEKDFVIYYFNVDDPRPPPSRDEEFERFMGNFVSFTWYLVDDGVNIDSYFYRNFRDSRTGKNLNAVTDVSGLYFSDINSRISYYWIQDGYVFNLSVPQWTISGEYGTIDKHTANHLVMNSALKVDIIKRQNFIAPESITLNKTEADLEIGETIILTAAVTPSNVTISTVYWSSSNNDAITVDQNGIVTRVGPWAATVTARVVASGLIATFEMEGNPVESGFR